VQAGSILEGAHIQHMNGMNASFTLFTSQKNPTGLRPLIRRLLLAAAMAITSAFTQGQTKYIAYDVPGGRAGNQNLTGASVGMDFDVANEVVVTRLGFFDDNSDGLAADATFTARLWDRSQTPPVQLGSVEFTSADPGELIGGTRFKALAAPIRLPVGFRGTISSDGYVPTERIFNSFGTVSTVFWTTNTGGGSLQFVGGSRYGGAGVYPATVDGGPVARYASASFEFETTAFTHPQKPVVTIRAEDQQIILSWDAVTIPAPAVKYLIHRAATDAGPFEQIAETTNLSYTNTALANGTPYSYTVTSVAAGDKASVPSQIKTAAAYKLAASHFVAYHILPSVTGNQLVGDTALGMDFDVQNPIIIKRLGVFDSDGNGFGNTMTVRIYNRDTLEVVATAQFWAEEPGVLVDGQRLKPLDTPLRLEAGFKGTIQADGFRAPDPNYNAGATGFRPWTRNDGGNASILFVGRSRNGALPDQYPTRLDGGPADRYGAGTFEFEALPSALPGTPQVTLVRPFEESKVTLNWLAVTNPLVAAKYEIERQNTDGVFVKIADTTGLTYVDTTVVNGKEYCYQVRAVAAGGQNSFYSSTFCATPNPRMGGIAYEVPETVLGNQNVTGTGLGMDFDVYFPINITELGVFDENLDGFSSVLTALIYNRTNTTTPVVSLTFDGDLPGTLIGATRFKPLPAPLRLEAGFKGSVVVWGFTAVDRNHNTFGTVNPELKTFEGGSILFVGGSRYGANGGFPGTADGGPVNRYAAGSFKFEPVAGLPRLTITRNAAKVRVEWTLIGVLQTSDRVDSGWGDVNGAVSGVEIDLGAANQYFRVKQSP
jgi:hypothetical protein